MLALIALLQIAAPAGDAPSIRPIAQLLHTRWTPENGAPSNITALAQTPDGYLWIGTWSRGLVRFDGVRFLPFVPRKGDVMPSAGGIHDLLATRDGSLWIVWGSGAVSRIHDGRTATWTERDGLAPTFSLTESSSGTLVAGTATGLARFADGAWEDVSREWAYPGTESQGVWFDREGHLWAQTEDRVVYLPPGQRFVDTGMRLRIGPASAQFAQEADGTVWMAELSRSAHTVGRAGDRAPVTEVMVGARRVLIDRKGSLWVATAGDGLRRVVDPRRIRGRAIAQFGAEAEHFGEKEGLLSDVVDALLEDREGNIWVGTFRGLERFRESAFTPYAVAGSYRPRRVYATSDTAVWTSALNEYGIIRLDTRGATRIDTDFVVTNLVEDRSGDVWTVSDGGLFRLRSDRFERVPLRGSDAVDLLDITIDPEGRVWAYDRSLGLLRLDDREWVAVASISHPQYEHGALFGDSRGRIWVAQYHRVVLYDHGSLALFDGAGAPSWSVHSFFEDRAGTIWGAGPEIGSVAGDRLRILSSIGGNADRFLLAMLQDEGGAWWLLAERGLMRVPPGELERRLADSTHVVPYRLFDSLDGLPGSTAPAIYGQVMTRTPDGRIWVAVDGGVASIDPRNLPRADPPEVRIEAIRLDGVESLLAGDVRVPPGRREIEIDYTAMTLTTPERVRFRYRLEGEDPTWQEVGARRTAYYNQIPPGTHRFHVTASSDEGVWNEAGAVLTFVVLPAWYQTLWFRLALILAIGGVGASAAALVQRRRHLRSHEALTARYEATMAERTRIAQDLHDTLLQGFAGVALQLKTAELALPDRPDIAAETLVRVQRLTRESLMEARVRVWQMHDDPAGGRDLPDALEASARDGSAGTGIEVAVTTAGRRRRLGRSTEDAAFHVAREAIANAVKHADARRIEIHVDFGVDTLRVRVRDDGRGVTAERLDEARRTGHFGVSGIRARAERAGGRCDVFASPDGGTDVALELPLDDPRRD